MLAPIKLRIKYEEEAQIAFYFLFFRYRVFPKKQKREKKRISRKDFLSRLFPQVKKKKKKSISKKTKKDQKKKKASALDIFGFLKSSSGFLKKILNSFLKRAKVKVAEINIVVATEDPSRTAIMYGLISQGVAYLLEILDNFTTLKKCYKGNISVIPDFIREDSSIKLDLLLQLRPVNILGLLFSALIYTMKNPDFLKSKSKNSQKQIGGTKKCQKTN